MNTTENFTIYNASAGSGKTYNLAKEYIKLLLATDNALKFKEILAITFTNKAAAEMKMRILGYLEDFSKGKTTAFFNELQEEIAADATLMQKRAQGALQGILHNYSAFAVTTIDKFTHKLIKSFAHDMELPVNFEVELDTDKISQESVATLLEKIGENKQLDNALVAYALDKAAADESWNISDDLNKAAKLLFEENTSKHIKPLREKNINDFLALRKTLYMQMVNAEKSLDSIVDTYFSLLENNGIAANDLASVPTTFFKNIKKRVIDFSKDTLANNLAAEKPFYSKKTPEDIKGIITNITPKIAQLHKDAKVLFLQYKKYKNLLKEVRPLTVINEIQKEYVALKEDNNMLLIAEFNELISKELKNQAAPYIYERIGERYHHFFIDEFQDTSELQWQNLIPLIQNAVQSEYAPNQAGTLLLVGDAKQAIYRFRGGKAEQFIGLSQEENPFFVPKTVKNLETNYRSFDQIIKFTNDFFTFIKDKFQDENYKKIYEIGNKQKANAQKGGYVSLSFVAGKNVAELHESYGEKIVAQIQELLKHNFDYKDIAILTRKRKQGVAVAHYLAEAGIPILSSETLLLENNNKIKLLIALLKLTINTNDEIAQIQFLEQFFAFQNRYDTRDELYRKFIKNVLPFFEILQEFEITFDLDVFQNFGLFDGLSYAVHQFGFDQENDAYIQYFLDLIFEFVQYNSYGWMAFLEYWEEKHEKLSIAVPEGQNAVQIMTIHKSKGLEFPVVIYPYADNNIYDDQNKNVWLDTREEVFEGFDNLRFSDIKSLEYLDDEDAKAKWKAYRSALELDAINILYVTLTRAVEQLYVLAAQKELTKDPKKPKTNYAAYFQEFLELQSKWQADETDFHFGEFCDKKTKETTTQINTETVGSTTIQPWQLLTNSKGENSIKTVTRDSQLWNTERGEAIDLGNLIHHILEDVFQLDDVQLAVRKAVNQGLLSDEKSIITTLEKLVNHPKLKTYFHPNITVFNEQEIHVPSGMLQKQTIIIDRLVILPNNEVVIIDYKTGEHKTSYINQLNEYQRVLEDMNYTIKEKLLVYIDVDLDEVEVVAV